MADFQVSIQYKINWGEPNKDGVIFPLDSKLDDVARGLAEKHGSLGGGSGCGMGFRDLEFEFDDVEKAKAFEKNLKEYPRFLDVSVHETTCLEDMLAEVSVLLPKAKMDVQAFVLEPYLEGIEEGLAEKRGYTIDNAVKHYTESETLWAIVGPSMIDAYLESTNEGIRNGVCDRDDLLENLNHLRSNDVKNNQDQ